MKNATITAILGIMFIYALASILAVSFDREQKRQCLVWQQQSKEYALFFLSENNQAGCDSIGVSIDAPFTPAQ